jgi:APA family basic amino acid/polyamine antiporter
MGGMTALAGAFVYAELAVLRPNLGGQYTYLQEAFHPSVAFLYGWALLLVMQTGGMAAVAVTLLRDKYETVITPGQFFGAPNYVRIGVGGDAAVLSEGLNRLHDAVSHL